MLGLFKRKSKPISVFYKPETNEIVYAKCLLRNKVFVPSERDPMIWTGMPCRVRARLRNTIYLGVL